MISCSKYFLLIPLVFTGTLLFASGKNSLKAITKQKFDKGTSLSTTFYKDKKEKKKNGVLFVSKNCRVFKDNITDEHYEEYNYVGSIDKAHRYEIVTKALNNGDEYYILDTRGNCKVSHLCGQPHLLNSIIVNLNEAQVTDAKKFIEIWSIGQTGIKKVATVDLEKQAHKSNYIDPIELRISAKRKLMFKSQDGGYWEVELTLP